ncbi:unnamed protein product [Cylindrotheca closterium]|uniref:MORN repeat-containing protein 5 n=1 Tax=Cylindrotheca closterium TaxID=2856 RepID=A0AAD2G6P1_9STRA|nr:unnamed protein product [Cylindrotheca closterium]
MAESSSQANMENPPANSQNASQAASNSTPLPKCFCNWKHCRTYQKAFREYKHPFFNGVIKLKFTQNDSRSMGLKSTVDRVLHVDSARRNDWKDGENGEPFCRYYVARHHFTEALINEYFQDRRGWDWNKPLSMREAKKLLWSLDRDDVYLSDDEESNEEDDRYVQAPNVPKDKVREMLKEFKDQHKKALAAESTPNEQETVDTARSTLSNSVADTLKVFEDSVGQEDPDTKDVILAEKEEENRRLRDEIQECQQQLNSLRDMVKKLVDMDRSRSSEPTKKKKSKSKSKSRRRQESSSEDEDEDSSSEEEWSQERERNQQSDDDDETISTLHVNGEVGGQQARVPVTKPRRPAQPVRKTSIHSRRSVRRTSVHSRRESIHSRKSLRRESYHSRRSMRGGASDDASVVSRQSLASVSPSIKSLPREIELNDEEEEDSFFDDSYRKPDDDARSVGSRSAASKASRRSFVSGQRSRGRNSRRPTTASTGSSRKKGAPGPPNANASTSDSRSKGSDGGSGNGRNVPREIDLSGDELEDVTYSNVSNDTSFVKDRQIVDPYGEKGVYTGELSKSTCMPNGRGRLEYEKEGRWYEGDWIHGRWTGTGCLSNGDGDFYEGGLKNDHKHGEGIMKFADGRIFEGEYIRGQMIQGQMTYQDGSVYGGSWVDGMRHGKGKCVFVDGSEYDGEFREGNFHGHGKMTWNDGGWYVGEWCDGEMHGRGKEIRPDGSLRHDGEWARGQPIRSAADSRRRRQQMPDS